MKTTREMLGMTQPELAAFLGVTRSMIAMAESNLRSLPTAALIEYSRFEQIVNQAAADKTLPEAAGSQTVQRQVDNILLKHREECRWQATLAQRKLDKLLKAHDQNLLKLKVAALLKPAQRKGGADNYVNHVAHNMERQAINTIATNGVGAIALLRLKIAGWQQQAEEAERQLKMADKF